MRGAAHLLRRTPPRPRPVRTAAPTAPMAAVAALEGLDPDGFHLGVQPIVDAATGAVVAGEVLIRGRDRAGRVVRPGSLVRAAERAGLATTLDRWVLEELGRTRRSGRLGLDRFSVNLSLASLERPDAAQHLVEAATEVGLAPSSLMVEVTETAASDDLDLVTAQLDVLRAAGFTVAIDDLGSGFADLRRLRLLPHDVIKLDGDMVATVATDPLHRAMVESCLHIAAVHRRPVIAEGVESEECLRTLRRLGVPYVQGYLLGRPHPLDGSPLAAQAPPSWATPDPPSTPSTSGRGD